MQRTSLRTLPSLSAALLLLVICFANNFSTIDQGISIICHQVLGMRDTPHSRNHSGSNHQHRHPGQKEPHRHGDPAQAFVLNDLRLDLKMQITEQSGTVSMLLLLSAAAFLLSLVSSGFDAAKYFSSTIRPPGLLPYPSSMNLVPVYALSTAPNAPPTAPRR